jgi:hypothetical protein
MRLRATLVVEYDADPDDYFVDIADATPKAMAEIDEAATDVLAIMAEGTTVHWSVLPVVAAGKEGVSLALEDV